MDFAMSSGIPSSNSASSTSELMSVRSGMFKSSDDIVALPESAIGVVAKGTSGLMGVGESLGMELNRSFVRVP